MGLDNPLHIAFLVVILLLVFGARRLPEIGRSLGSGLREFKESITGETKQATITSGQQQQPAAQQAVPQPAAQPVAAPPAAEPLAPEAPAPTAPPSAGGRVTPSAAPPDRPAGHGLERRTRDALELFEVVVVPAR